MDNIRVLYQIKSLDNLICRNFICNDNNYKSPKTPTQIQIIEYMLKHCDEEIYQRDLEKVLNLRRATVSGVLQTMEKNELIERVTNVSDARIKKIILNENAKKLFLQHKNKLEELETIITSNIKKEELDIFLRVVNLMKENIKKL